MDKSLIRRERLNKVHLPLIEMARTVKVTAGTEQKKGPERLVIKIALMKKEREENKKRAKRKRGRKEKQLKIEREEKRKERGRYRVGCRPSRKSKKTKRGQTY